MSMQDAPDPSGDVKIRWIKPGGFRSTARTTSVTRSGVSPQPVRRTSSRSIWRQPISSPSWDGPNPTSPGEYQFDPPACLVAYGCAIEPKEQARLALAGIQAIDVAREGLGLQGPSNAMLADLVRSAVMTQTLVVPNPAICARAVIGRLAALHHAAEPRASLGPDRPVRRAGAGRPALVGAGVLSDAGSVLADPPGRAGRIRHRRQTLPGQHPRPDGPRTVDRGSGDPGGVRGDGGGVAGHWGRGRGGDRGDRGRVPKDHYHVIDTAPRPSSARRRARRDGFTPTSTSGRSRPRDAGLSLRGVTRALLRPTRSPTVERQLFGRPGPAWSLRLNRAVAAYRPRLVLHYGRRLSAIARPSFGAGTGLWTVNLDPPERDDGRHDPHRRGFLARNHCAAELSQPRLLGDRSLSEAELRPAPRPACGDLRWRRRRPGGLPGSSPGSGRWRRSPVAARSRVPIEAEVLSSEDLARGVLICGVCARRRPRHPPNSS